MFAVSLRLGEGQVMWQRGGHSSAAVQERARCPRPRTAGGVGPVHLFSVKCLCLGLSAQPSQRNAEHKACVKISGTWEGD